MREPVEFKKVLLPNGETLTYRERKGKGQTLLLIHGNMTSSKHWDLLMEEIDPSFHLFAVDLRGFGGSTYHQPIDSLRDFADDVHLFVSALELTSFIVMGWSMGGGVALQFVADYPEYIQKCILLASASTRGYPFFRVNEQGQPVERFKTKEEIIQDPIRAIPITQAYEKKDKEFLRYLWNSLIYTHNQPSLDRYEEYLEDMCTQRNLVDVYHALNHFNISTVDQGLGVGTGTAQNIQVPTLVLWGKHDLVVTEQMTNEIMEDLGENAQLIYLENCGHSPLVDDLQQLLTYVTSFIKTE